MKKKQGLEGKPDLPTASQPGRRPAAVPEPGPLLRALLLRLLPPPRHEGPKHPAFATSDVLLADASVLLRA